MRIQSSVDIHMQDLLRFGLAPTRMSRNWLETWGGFSMAEKSRGTALTVFALLFVLLAISDFAKPLSHDPNIGFVFLGSKLTGTGNAIMGPLFSLILVIFAYGIWTMRVWARPVAYIYTGWVIVNMVLYSMKNHNVPQPSPLFTIASIVVGVGVPLLTAITLSRRSADLT
jgi:hypothetical protein